MVFVGGMSNNAAISTRGHSSDQAMRTHSSSRKPVLTRRFLELPSTTHNWLDVSHIAFEVGHLRRKTQRFPASCRNRRRALQSATALYTTSLCVPATHQMNDLRDSKQLLLVQLRFGAYRFEILGWFSLSLLLVGPFLAVSLASPPKMTEGGVGPVSGP